MDLLAVVLVFFTTVAAVIALGSYWFARRERIRVRLAEVREIEKGVETEDVMRLPFMERVGKPMLNGLGKTLGNLAPGEIRSRVEKQIVYSGNPWKVTFNGLVAIQLISGATFFLLSLGMLRLMQLTGGRLILLVLFVTLLGFVLPVALLNSRAEKRKKSIQKQLPDMLDMLLVSVEAGLGFDMALQRVVAQMPGHLSDELNRALEDIRMGSTREEALRGVVRRTGVPELSSFISSVIQAEQLGSNIASTLRVQAASIRQSRRQRVEEIAMKAPVKMLFPLLFFIFPSLFVVILGPAAIRIFQMFQEML